MRPLGIASLLALVTSVPLFAADPAIQFDPKEPLTDEPVAIRVTGLPPGSACTVRSRLVTGGKNWQGVATFKADAQGTVDVSKQRGEGDVLRRASRWVCSGRWSRRRAR